MGGTLTTAVQCRAWAHMLPMANARPLARLPVAANVGGAASHRTKRWPGHGGIKPKDPSIHPASTIHAGTAVIKSQSTAG